MKKREVKERVNSIIKLIKSLEDTQGTLLSEEDIEPYLIEVLEVLSHKVKYLLEDIKIKP